MYSFVMHAWPVHRKETDSSWLSVPQVEVENYLANLRKFSNQAEFRNFRNFAEWKQWEGGEKIVGEISLNAIEQNGNLKLFNELVSQFRISDSVGNPKLYNFNGVDNISSSALQYANDALCIKSRMQESQVPLRPRIVEIGGGFGGLCVAISVVIDFHEYIIIDLPEALVLQKMFLGEFPDVYKRCKFISAYDKQAIEEIGNSDLAIACASLAELDFTTQKFYNINVILKSRSSYIAYNSLFRDDSRKIFLRLLSTWVQEFSITSWVGLQGRYLMLSKSSLQSRSLLYPLRAFLELALKVMISFSSVPRLISKMLWFIRTVVSKIKSFFLKS